MSTVLARLGGRLRHDGGFTLAEMLTVMAMLGVITSVAFGALIASRQTVTGTAVRFDQVQQAKAATESLTRTLRTAVVPTQVFATCSACGSAFLTADASTVQFYANVSNPAGITGPSRVTYALAANGDLTETVQPPDAHVADDFNFQYCAPVSATCKAWTRTIARGVVASASAPLFGYTDVAGATIAVPVSAARLADVKGMDLALTVRSSTQVKGSTVVTHVSMPNADALPQATSTATATP